jgi:hypothetical protein
MRGYDDRHACMHRLPCCRHLHVGLHAHSHIPAYQGNRVSLEVLSTVVSARDGHVMGRQGAA